MKIISLYDGTTQSKTALQYGIGKTKEKGGELIVLQVFQSSMFIDYGAGPGAEEIARAEARRYMDDARKIIAEKDAEGQARILFEEGTPEEEVLRIAQSERADLILTPPRYKAIAKTAPCPVYIIPGTILVPLDNTEGPTSSTDCIIDEARATGSKVVLLGIVPDNLYSISEHEELEKVKKGTAAVLKKTTAALSLHGITVSEIIRSGYPDEEIVKAAAEHSASIIFLPSGGKTPSELSKAAAILLDEPDRLHIPLELLQGAGA